MANNRQKKKKARPKTHSLSGRKGYAKKENDTSNLTKQERKRLANQRLADRKKQYIEENHLNEVSLNSIWTHKKVANKPTTRSTWKELEKLNRKRKSDAKQQTRIKTLVNAGYEPTEIRKSWVLSEKSTRGYLDKKSGSYGIDWNKIYHTDKAIFFSFKDISQNCDLKSIIRNYLSMPIKELLKELWKIVQHDCTYDPETHSGSSGKAGQARIEFGTDSYVDKVHDYNEVVNRTRHTDYMNRLKKKRKYKHSMYHTYIPFQKLNGGHIHDTTLKNMVAIITAILNNVFEDNRRYLYNHWYDIVTEIEPKIKDYIPPDF